MTIAKETVLKKIYTAFLEDFAKKNNIKLDLKNVTWKQRRFSCIVNPAKDPRNSKPDLIKIGLHTGISRIAYSFLWGDTSMFVFIPRHYRSIRTSIIHWLWFDIVIRRKLRATNDK